MNEKCGINTEYQLPLKVRGDHCVECPYCGRVFGNGISVVYSNIVRSCSCSGMRKEALMTKNGIAVGK